MVKIYFFIIIFFAACSSSSHQTGLTLKSILSGRPQNQITQTVSNREEAEQIIRRKASYYQSLFEQSFDPYYGTPKYKEDCLKENLVGSIQVTKQSSLLVMRLALDSKYEAGFCTSSSNPAVTLFHMVYYHCHQSKEVHRLVVSAKINEVIQNWEELCPEL